MTAISRGALEAAGYVPYVDHMKRGVGYVGSWSKWKRAESGVRRYSIHVDGFDHSLLDASLPKRDSFSAHVQFDTAGGTTFNAEMLLGEEGIEDVETFFERMFVSMACVDYDDRHDRR